MTKFTLTHEFNCTPEVFWQVFFDKDFNTELYLRGLGFPEYSVLDQRETDAQITRKTSGQPKMSLPGPVEKLLGAGFRYTEEGTFDKATKKWRFKLTPSTLADKLRHEGTVRCEAVGEGRCRRIVDLEMEAKIFGLGGLVESSSEKQMRDGWEKSAEFQRQWLARKAT
jgi:hypothetical protein